MTEVKLDFDKQGGLVPVIVTDYKTGQVLMLAYMNEVSYQLTLETKQMHYWSRSRNELWQKGATSGHFQHVKSIKTDCDQDTLDRKSTRLNSSHTDISRMPSSA